MLFDSPMDNIISLHLANDGFLYAGSDTEGLVYKINLADKTALIAYDTDKQEISSITSDKQGMVYFATADTDKARPGAKLVLSNDNKPKNTDDDKKDSETESADNKTETSKRPPATRTRPRRRSESNGDSGNGNIVYKLSPQGYAEKIFSSPVIIHDITLSDANRLYLATGIEGNLISINLDDLSSTVVFDSESAQISAILSVNDKLYLGCADAASIAIVKPELAKSGTFTSDVFDARQPSKWGVMYIDGSELENNITVKVRTGNTSDPDNGGWSDWYKTTVSLPMVTYDIPVSRFIQYELTLTADSESSPEISEVQASFSVPNLKPEIIELTLEKPEQDQNMPLEEAKKIQVACKQKMPTTTILYMTFRLKLKAQKAGLKLQTMSWKISISGTQI